MFSNVQASGNGSLHADSVEKTICTQSSFGFFDGFVKIFHVLGADFLLKPVGYGNDSSLELCHLLGVGE